MYIKSSDLFLTLIILDPNSLSKSIDVYFRPLIDELKILWNDGVLIYDTHSKQNFMMKAVFVWIINDFLTYGMLSGKSIHGNWHVLIVWSTQRHLLLNIVENQVGLTAIDNFCHPIIHFKNQGMPSRETWLNIPHLLLGWMRKKFNLVCHLSNKSHLA